MNVMRILILILATSGFLLTGCATSKSRIPSADIGTKTVILGRLGRPIGEEITIHGYKEPRHPMSSPDEFRIDTVNGEKLAKPTVVIIHGVDKWPSNTEATIRGYEAGEIRFEYIHDANRGPDDGRFKTHQVIWMSFKGVEVVTPTNLKLGYLGDAGDRMNVKINR